MNLVNGIVKLATRSICGGYEVVILLDSEEMLENLKPNEHVGIIEIVDEEKQ